MGPPAEQALVSPQHQVERAAGDLRRGMPVLLRAGVPGGSAFAAAAETVRDETLAALEKAALEPTGAPPLLVLSHARAATLKIPLYTPDVVLIALSAAARGELIRAIADPATDLDYPIKGPFEPQRDPPPPSAAAAMKLAKLAGLLPAAVLYRAEDNSAERFAEANGVTCLYADAVFAFEARAALSLKMMVRARVPLAGAEHCELVAFRPADGGPEHFAILIGDKTGGALATPGPVLARLHSECFTGDLLASLKCDCGEQLRGAVEAIQRAGGGILLYLAQEGRGIGLMNKLRAYRLQDEGFDTLEANERLGFEPDERLYDIAAQMLTQLGYGSVRLMTNNPEKIRALEKAGVRVAERVAHSFPDNFHNREYLRVKKTRGGHLT